MKTFDDDEDSNNKHDYFDDFRKNELRKCAKDPMYFIENYVMITDTSVGEVLFKPYEYQKNIINAFNEHKNTICMVGRQMGKCVHGDTYINANGEEIKISKLIKLSYRDRVVNFLESMLVKLAK